VEILCLASRLLISSRIMVFSGMDKQIFRAIAVVSAAKAIDDGEGLNKLLADAYHLERFILTGCAPEERETVELTRCRADRGS
jgi:hypothetical protein